MWLPFKHFFLCQFLLNLLCTDKMVCYWWALNSIITLDQESCSPEVLCLCLHIYVQSLYPIKRKNHSTHQKINPILSLIIVKGKIDIQLLMGNQPVSSLPWSKLLQLGVHFWMTKQTKLYVPQIMHGDIASNILVERNLTSRASHQDEDPPPLLFLPLSCE